ncbi:LLM class flavin-dependent oxidoreductase [Streptomyces sp. NBC_01190]|uniref:LLM class flavin-dependent oxidoreductase n=1 Tax=Streptomyces sp. NBC_01190 TaxID=2903767 RepID=UPI0038667763|nr:LLM class flavin-dependent oxidoreductase [Streptomyces sp. NBC_01190]
MTEPSPAGGPSFKLGFLTHVQGRGDGWARTYRHAQELFVAADELGFDVGWVAQHHVGLGGGGLSSPWPFLAHAAARTRRIRLGTAVTTIPLEDPVRLAEDVAVVDTLSGGRVELGVGSGASDTEYAAFGKDLGRRRELTTENLALVRRTLAGEEVRTPGFRIQPAPGDFTDRIWQGVFSEAGARHAAAAGSNLLLNRAAYGFDAPTDEVQHPWADAYLAAWDQPRRPRIGLSRFVFPAKDRRTALKQIGDDVHRAALRFAARGAFPEGPGPRRGAAPFPLLLRPPRRDHHRPARGAGPPGGHRSDHPVQPRRPRPRRRDPRPRTDRHRHRPRPRLETHPGQPAARPRTMR